MNVGQPPPLRGQGYMKKGGRAATDAHNERARAAAAAAVQRSAAAEARADDQRTDGRVSGRSAAGRTPWRSDAALCAAASIGALVALVVDRLV